jgi:hypothetical protein
MVLPDWHHSLSLARKPKILAPRGYIISCNAPTQRREDAETQRKRKSGRWVQTPTVAGSAKGPVFEQAK